MINLGVNSYKQCTNVSFVLILSDDWLPLPVGSLIVLTYPIQPIAPMRRDSDE
jgi:hypothetical protein